MSWLYVVIGREFQTFRAHDEKRRTSNLSIERSEIWKNEWPWRAVTWVFRLLFCRTLSSNYIFLCDYFARGARKRIKLSSFSSIVLRINCFRPNSTIFHFSTIISAVLFLSLFHRLYRVSIKRPQQCFIIISIASKNFWGYIFYRSSVNLYTDYAACVNESWVCRLRSHFYRPWHPCWRIYNYQDSNGGPFKVVQGYLFQKQNKLTHESDENESDNQ